MKYNIKQIIKDVITFNFSIKNIKKAYSTYRLIEKVKGMKFSRLDKLDFELLSLDNVKMCLGLYNRYVIPPIDINKTLNDIQNVLGKIDTVNNDLKNGVNFNTLLNAISAAIKK